MMLHCPDCDARAFLFDYGIVQRPTCLDCGRPLPMPGAEIPRVSGPMSPYVERPRSRSRQQQLHA